MKKTIIPMLAAEEMHPDLTALLRPRVERLGYLGEFFRYTAHQPEALMSFLTFTEDLKRALPDNLTEVVALTVANLMKNDYERVQHERLSLKKGFGEKWLRAVLTLRSQEGGGLSQGEIAVQRLAIAMVDRRGHDCAPEVESVNLALGPATTIAVLMLIGRYVTHAMIVNALQLAPPVPSPLEAQ